MRRSALGVIAALACVAACTAVMVPFRGHIAVATTALVLVVPVIAGVSIGGLASGVISALVAFLALDWFFIPPYSTLTVGGAANWVALVVFVVVVLIVARLVEFQQHARREAALREDAIRRLFEISESLIGARPLGELLDLVVSTIHATFRTRWAALLLPEGDALVIAATAGVELSAADRAAALGPMGRPQPLALVSHDGEVSRVALTVSQRPVGQLVIAGATLLEHERELLGTFANQAALAIERSQLREHALRVELLEEVDRWRSALIGAVSHDLRTPLASMKAAVSTLRDAGAVVSSEDQASLLEMIEDQGDHLARLVENLLDMARIEAGTLVAHREPHSVADVVEAAVGAIGTALDRHVLVVTVDPALPLVDVDLVLIAQVVANLLVNAAQHSAEGSTITVGAVQHGGLIAVSVGDEGPGVPAADRERIFHMLDRHAGSGRAGLGLAISTAFVEAHGERLVVGDAPGGGAMLTFSVPVVDELGADS